jgi:hypothetical protein
MTDNHANNALTEIALALATAFFSIMILAMISMGAGLQADAKVSRAVVADMVLSKSDGRADNESNAASRDQPPTFLFFYRGDFYESDLTRVDPQSFSSPGPVVLAIDPSLSMEAALQARATFSRNDITVTTFTEHWLDTFKEIQ